MMRQYSLRVMLSALLLWLLVSTAEAREWDVMAYGAVADGATDCTPAFQAALDAAGAAGGGSVLVPSGEFRFDGSLTVPYGVSLQGSYETPSTFQPTESPMPFAGTTFLVYGGKGSNKEPAFIRLAGKMSALRGVLIRYPEATIDVVPPDPYPPTILMNQWVTTVENVCLLNSYEGIRMREAGRHLVRNVHGYPTWRGITVDWIQDVGRIENCHFSPMGFPFEPDGPYMQWVFANGIAFDFHQSDWQYVTNTFCFGYNVGYRFGASKMGTVNGNFLGIAADCVRTAILVDQASPVGVLISNGEFVGQWGYGRSVGVDIPSGSEGTVNLSNCAFWGPFDRLIRMRGEDARLVATACNFESWDNDGDDSEAIQVDAGRAIIQGSFFREARKHVHVGADARAVTLIGNQADGGLQIANHAGARLRRSANEEDLRSFPEEALLHYRVKLGETGDSRFLVRWGAQGEAVEWPEEDRGKRRWTQPGSILELPVVPHRSYTLKLQAYVPEEALGPKNGLYMENGPELIFEEAGFVTLTMEIPPQEDDVVRIECRAQFAPEDPEPLFQLFFAADELVMQADNAADKCWNANEGDWIK